MFDSPDEVFRPGQQPVMRVAVKLNPFRRQVPGVWHLLTHRLAAMRGIGAGTPSDDIRGHSDLEVTVWYDEPHVKRALLDALDGDVDVQSYEIVEPRKAVDHV
jgi:hypothetical protein